MSDDLQGIDDALLYAWVDGELDAAAAARMAAAVKADPALAARAARQRALRAQLQTQFAPVLDEPIPARLLTAIGAPPAAVTDLDRARARRDAPARPRWALPEWSAIAATLVTGTLLGALVFRTPTGLPIESVDGQLMARGDLDAALSMQPAGTAPAEAVARIGLSFRAGDGAYCRTFSLRTGPDGLACRRQGHWAIQVLDHSEPSPGAPGDYRQAGSALSPALLGAITALGAGDVLSSEQERQQLRSGWEARTP